MKKIIILCMISTVLLVLNRTLEQRRNKNPIPKEIIEVIIHKVQSTRSEFLLDCSLQIKEQYNQGISMNNYETTYKVVVVSDLFEYREELLFSTNKKLQVRIGRHQNLLNEAYYTALLNRELTVIELLFYAVNNPDELLYVVDVEIPIYE